MMFAVLGEAIVDLVAGADGRFTPHPGGSPLNVAVGLARLGRPTALLARLSTTTFGVLLHDHAETNGVDLTVTASATEPASLAVVSTDGAGQPRYDFYVDGTADWQWRPGELQVPSGTQILHTGSLATWQPPGAEQVANAVAGARAAGTTLISYDPNVRPGLLGDPATGRRVVDRYVALAHLVKASAEDLSWLYPGIALPEVAYGWLATGGPRLVVVTDGSRGCRAFRAPGDVLEVPATPVRVVDTVGAGDAFMAALLDGLAHVGVVQPDGLSGISRDALAGVLRRASLAAALTCGRPGADPPGTAELAAAAG